MTSRAPARWRAESAPAGSVFHCADDTPTTYREFMTRTAEAIGTGPPRSLPVWLARRVAGEGPVATVVRSARTSNAKLRPELGWEPKYPDSRDGIPRRRGDRPRATPQRGL